MTLFCQILTIPSREADTSSGIFVLGIGHTRLRLQRGGVRGEEMPGVSYTTATTTALTTLRYDIQTGPLHTQGVAGGCPGGVPRAFVRGVRGWALSLPQPPVLRACGQRPLPTDCGCGVRAWGPALPTVRVALPALTAY